jgi:hypothetical protein
MSGTVILNALFKLYIVTAVHFEVYTLKVPANALSLLLSISVSL